MEQVTLTIRGSGANGVIHAGFRRWITAQTQTLGLFCHAENLGDICRVTLRGFPNDIAAVIALAKRGPPGSRVLDVELSPERSSVS